MKIAKTALLAVCVALASPGCTAWKGRGGAASPSAPASPSASASPSAVPPSPSASSPSASAGPSGPAAAPPASPAPSEPADPVREQIGRMSLEEKIGQMLLAGFSGTSLSPEARRMIAEDRIGGVILYADNFGSLKTSVSLINALKKANRNNPAPLLLSVDQEGGKVNRLPKNDFVAIPSAATVGKTGNPALAAEMGRLLARELKSVGLNTDFAPVLDVNSNPDNPVIGTRAFGSTAGAVKQFGIAAMNGIRKEGVISVVKHFPGHGDTSVDSHLDLPVVDKTPEQLAKLEWIPFREAVRQQADAIMVAHILFPQIDSRAPASFSAKIVGEELRGQFGYKGVVITDDMNMGAIAKHYDIAQAAVDAVKAGVDILLVAHGADTEKKVRAALLNSVRSGTLTTQRIDESVYRILSLKRKYKLTDDAVPVPDLTGLNRSIRDWLDNVAK
jgi:beta-N-acetylhexosaminidase